IKLNTLKLEENEKKYRALVENGGDAVAILAADGKPTYVSPSVKTVLGYTEKEALALNLFEILHPEDVIGVQKALEVALAKPGVPVSGYTSRLKHKDGTWHWYESTITNLLHDPIINGIVDNFRDVTHRKLLEEKQSLLAAVVNSTDDAIYTTDLNGIITSWNKGAEKLFGFNAHVALHKN